jgi:hypothetical protein
VVRVGQTSEVGGFLWQQPVYIIPPTSLTFAFSPVSSFQHSYLSSSTFYSSVSPRLIFQLACNHQLWQHTCGSNRAPDRVRQLSFLPFSPNFSDLQLSVWHHQGIHYAMPIVIFIILTPSSRIHTSIHSNKGNETALSHYWANYSVKSLHLWCGIDDARLGVHQGCPIMRSTLPRPHRRGSILSTRT